MGLAPPMMCPIRTNSVATATVTVMPAKASTTTRSARNRAAVAPRSAIARIGSRAPTAMTAANQPGSRRTWSGRSETSTYSTSSVTTCGQRDSSGGAALMAHRRGKAQSYRQPHPRAQPAERAVLQHDVAAMRARDVARDGQPQPRPAGGEGGEGLEGLLALRPPGCPGRRRPPSPRPGARLPARHARCTRDARCAAHACAHCRAGCPGSAAAHPARSGSTSASPAPPPRPRAPSRRALAATSPHQLRQVGRARPAPCPRRARRRGRRRSSAPSPRHPAVSAATSSSRLGARAAWRGRGACASAACAGRG